MNVTLDKEAHVYHIDGRRAPGIHEILEATGVIDTFMRDEYALMRGQRIHTAIEHDIKWKGDFDESDMSEDERGCLAAARKAREELPLPVYPNQAEILSANTELWYATQIDALAYRSTSMVCVNWKTGKYYDYYAIQSAAEAMIVNPSNPLDVYRLSVMLQSDGNYHPIPHNEASDFKVWQGCCDIFNWKTKRGGGVRPKQPAPPPAPDTKPVEHSEYFNLPEWPEQPEGLF